MEKEVFEKELSMCRELSLKNGGGCNWGKCESCGVIPLLYKLGEGKIYEDHDEIKKIKQDTLGVAIKHQILIQEDNIEVAIEVNSKIVEFDTDYDKAYFENRYQDKDKLILVAYLENKPVGYMVSYNRDNDGSIYCWMAGVDPEFRRKGVLSRLMEYLEEWALEKGYSKIKIKTRNNRREMIAYLIKNGFYFTEIEKVQTIEDWRLMLEKDLNKSR